MKPEVYGGQSVEFRDTPRGLTLFHVAFHRTLRLPEDGRTHQLPPSLGEFPLRKIQDYREKVPPAWREHGGLFLPMWQREAMWLSFGAPSNRPIALKVAAGKVNAVSGEPWSETLAPPTTKAGAPRQDYLVCPPQPWLDGFNAGAERIRQFVAMPLGGGYTVEAQATGKEDVGGLQLLVVPTKPTWKPPAPPPHPRGPLRGSSSGWGGQMFGGANASAKGMPDFSYSLDSHVVATSGAGGGAASNASDSMDPTLYRSRGSEMGLAQGGEMVQKIYPDPYGLDAWDEKEACRLFVHLVNSELWTQITGEPAPPSPVTAQTYRNYGYPWTTLWDSEMGDVPAAPSLSAMKTVSQVDASKGVKEGSEW